MRNKYLQITLLIIFSTTIWAAKLKPIILDLSYNHDKYQTKPTDIIREFRAYTVSFDSEDDDNGDGTPDKWGIPHWVSYEIKKFLGTIGKGPKRPSPWITEKALFDRGVVPTDDSYKYSKKFRKEHPNWYDRGHMCMKQIAFRLGMAADWNTHTLLNACPQRGKLNQGIWLDLEKKTQGWADKYGSVWIVTGPILYKSTPTGWVGEEGEVKVAIPDAFYKIVIRKSVNSNQPNVLAFIYPQLGIDYKKSGGYNHSPYLTSVDIIEALTGLDFLTALPDKAETEIEAIIQTTLWN